MQQFPVRVGLIGVHPEKGWAATAHIPALQALPDYRITALSHHEPATAQAAAQKFGVPHALASAEELVRHPEVDLVVVTVKVPQHHALVTQAIAAGKAVFSEWPLGVSLAEAEALRDLARERGVATAIGLQTRAAPPFVRLRELIAEGYVGRVLSVSVLGSGILWGATMPESYRYTLDRANGAAMLNVPFAHTLDGVLHAVGSGVASLSGMQGNARKTVRIEESGDEQPYTVADQVLLAAQLENGAALSAHFRGGLSRGTNFHVEINGSEGDLVLTSPVGYVGIGGFELRGARLDGSLQVLALPAAAIEGPAQPVAAAYARLASDLLHGTRLSPTFDDAVALHRLLARIEQRSAVLA
ncbi:Gfo/Idh/MocA family protein [Duganella callida]|uniref:Gfo/Idh/MocA family oxidoreductase n=1 Tax=Duganella callida TaxID=2561932 RepID=A0A4Y9SLH5_9BURK|nr:Gfo/Idh/MocA family oxidoreductase [Duganella callida]TFW24335.1 Gfo/Idh/MocA family oxidoreductase [Duganella callida]